jgi:hypothetical protein
MTLRVSHRDVNLVLSGARRFTKDSYKATSGYVCAPVALCFVLLFDLIGKRQLMLIQRYVRSA